MVRDALADMVAVVKSSLAYTPGFPAGQLVTTRSYKKENKTVSVRCIFR